MYVHYAKIAFIYGKNISLENETQKCENGLVK